MSNRVNLDPVKGLNDARNIFLEFCKKVSENKGNWTSSDFNAYMELVKQEVDNAYKFQSKGYFTEIGELAPNIVGHAGNSLVPSISELHNIISGALMTKIDNASDEELNKFIDAMTANFEKSVNLFSDDEKYLRIGEYGQKSLFAFYEQLYDLNDYISDFFQYNKELDVSFNEFKKISEEFCKKKISEMPMVRKVRERLQNVKKDLENVVGYETNQIDVIEGAVLQEIFPEEHYKYWLNIIYPKMSKDKEIKSIADYNSPHGILLPQFLIKVVEILEGVRDEKIFKTSGRDGNISYFSGKYPKKQSYDEFFNKYNEASFWVRDEIFISEIPSNLDLSSKELKEQVKRGRESVDRLKKMKNSPIEYKRSSLKTVIAGEWSNIEAMSKLSEKDLNFGFSSSYGPYSPSESSIHKSLAGTFTSSLSNELAFLSTMQVGDSILKEEIKNIAETYSSGNSRK